MHADLRVQLERRLGRETAARRLALETDLKSHVFRGRGKLFHLENMPAAPLLVRSALRLTGLYRRALRNAEQVTVTRNTVRLAALPTAFEGFTILQLSDLHIELCAPAMQRLEALLGGLDYDLCVLTGDYRGQTHGPFQETLAGLCRLRGRLQGEVYGVLGNHDSIRMVPALEAMGIQMLLNEAVALERAGDRLHLAGIDDAHYFAAHDVVGAAAAVPPAEPSILLSHTPEVYREAADAGFDLMLSGHTHGGQLCLPGGLPLTLGAAMPRRLGRGAWRHHDLTGYTTTGVGASIVPARLNCPPEVALHRLTRG